MIAKDVCVCVCVCERERERERERDSRDSVLSARLDDIYIYIHIYKAGLKSS